MRLDMHSRREVLKGSYREYQKANKKDRGALLDRLVPVTGMNRDYLATVLANYGKETVKQYGNRKGRPKGKRGGRPKEYGPEFVELLAVIWQDHGRPCGKLLVPMIHEMIRFLMEEHQITPVLHKQLLKVSPAEADLLLASRRKALALKGISTTRVAHLPLRDTIPVRTHFNREEKPGYFAFDTVAHCGASAKGHFCKTLTGTDVFSGWIEERALANAANRWVQEAFVDIEGTLPFPMKGAHYDNGMEFINEPLVTWCLKRHLEVTRTRPYHKNDNCFAEQKNFDAVRKTVGYFRFDTPGECAALEEVYRYLCPLYNYWYPSFKLIEKVKLENGRYKKIYEKQPKTPYQRLVDSPEIPLECKEELQRRKAGQNPVEINRKLNEAVEQLLRINQEKGYTEKQSGWVPAA